MVHRNAPVLGRQIYFIVDKAVVKICGCGIKTVAGVIYRIQPSPVDGPQAHGAWFAARVKDATRQPEIV